MTGDLRTRVMETLSGVPDPEIPVVSVVDLGIVRDVRDNPPAVIVTTTYMGCPATQAIQRSIREALDKSDLKNVAIEVAISPPWSTDWISDQGRDKLKAYGIAPPPKGADKHSLRNSMPAECPRCGSTNTREISRFGSTPCKALWQCNSCQEPFDRLTCH